MASDNHRDDDVLRDRIARHQRDVKGLFAGEVDRAAIIFNGDYANPMNRVRGPMIDGLFLF